MSVDNPNWFDRFMMTLESPLARRVMYRPFVDRMGLRGHEKVLDFGSGWGDVTRCMSPRLTDGGSITLMEPSAAWVETS
ncbi:MAG TPA: hypothetical protein VMS79_01790, partial [Methanomassiliicoccales archaeon]|nr:hypothetical protein [Methanomassiliicoccales archaeon]